MRPVPPRQRPPRRGLTLLEMLVTVALLVLMMTVIVSIFQAATGAMIIARTNHELDGNLRQLDSVIRQDLIHATADTGSGPLVPPFKPSDGNGYFEYGEGQFADLQGEDSDDYLRFTAQAPEGQFFTGRMWVGPAFLDQGVNNPPQIPSQPITITSSTAEIIYFLRNGNLYRRVLLVAPERQQAVVLNSSGVGSLWQFPASAFGYSPTNQVFGSWQGMNDLSARPTSPIGGATLPPTLNTLSDLTNRENRAFSPRFADDYLTFNFGTSAWQLGADGQWDDYNPVNPTQSSPWPQGDGQKDWWPTLYPSVFVNTTLINPVANFPRLPNKNSNNDNPDLMSFPYLFPGAFSLMDSTGSADGTLHGMGNGTNQAGQPNAAVTGDPVVLNAIQGNPLPGPYGFVYNNGTIVLDSRGNTTQVNNAINRPNHNPLPVGDTLTTPDHYASTVTVGVAAYQTWWAFPTWKETMSPAWADPVFPLAAGNGAQVTGLSWANQSSGMLPALNDPNLDVQPYNDGQPTAGSPFATPPAVFRDDIIMQGVRSFDVKAYDNTVPGYVDLGYSNFVDGAPNAAVGAALLTTMGHEGRIPPLTSDFRSDPNYPNWLPNLGDNTTGINRLRRVWDTWSTDYSQAPATGKDPTTGFLAGPPFSQPLYPSYPPPYPAALRGLQIQIRVVAPRNDRVKVLTIRHDFSS